MASKKPKKPLFLETIYADPLDDLAPEGINAFPTVEAALSSGDVVEVGEYRLQRVLRLKRNVEVEEV